MNDGGIISNFIVENSNIALFILTYMGAVCGHIFMFGNPDFRRITMFLKSLIPEKSDSFYTRLEFVILPLMGSILIFFIITPSQSKEAILTGLTWSLVITSLMKQQVKSYEEINPPSSDDLNKGGNDEPNEKSANQSDLENTNLKINGNQ